MRFHPDGPSIPDILLERCDAGRVVFLCGAGVSLPSGMPTFVELTEYVIEFFDPPANSEIMMAFQPWLENPSGANIPLDQIFNLLHLEYGKNEVNALVTKRLTISSGADCKRKHGLLKRISSSQSGIPQIVTTNFDRLFELDSDGERLVLHEPPAFPDLNFGSKIEGITYLHGRLAELDSENHSYVLSSADFGRAYLSEGWATNFIRNLLERYTVVLVGYKAEDPPVKYLLQGLNHDGQYDRSRLYAFDRGLPEDIEAKWHDRGVTAIAFSDYPDLWKSMEAWADRADDPRGWRTSIITKSRQDPKELAPHERGQVAHVLRTVQGARAFAEADPVPHPEWICVLDANVRSGELSHSYGDKKKHFDPLTAYGLDDDLPNISEHDRKQGVSNDNLLAWREEDDNPNDCHRLGGHVSGYETMPIRLGHLITWVGKSISSPVVAWWAVRQNGLHPRLLNQLKWQVENTKSLNERTRHIWNLILEYHRDPRNGQWDSDWFSLKRRVNIEGWTAGILREFRRVTTPRLKIRRPFGLGQSKPPCVHWEEISLNALGDWEVEFLDRHNEDLDIPDDLLVEIFRILQENIFIASGLLKDIDCAYFRTPTCYPGREVDGTEHVTEAAKIIVWFSQLYDRISVKFPKLAKAYAMSWPVADQFYFRQLKLYAFSKVEVFDPDYVAEEILSLGQDVFWDLSVCRELLFLLADRWGDFSLESRDQLISRILAGPNKFSHWSDEEFPKCRDQFVARYARYLELQGCELTAAGGRQLRNIIRRIPGWSDAWATSTVIKYGSYTRWVDTDEKPDMIIDLPVSEVIPRARENLKRDFRSFTEKRPFTGLVKTNPRKALTSLTIFGKRGDYPKEFWSSLIDNLPENITPRLKRVFFKRVARLPDDVIVELRYTLAQWLQEKFVEILNFDKDLGWVVYDRVVDCIFGGGEEITNSSLGEVLQGGEVILRSRRTLDHAINGPIGMCTQALFNAVPKEVQKAGSLLPDHIKSRAERLFKAPGEGSDHAVIIVSRLLDWIMFIDPAWSKDRLIPMLALDHPASEPAWNGFIYGGKVPRPALREIIKPYLLALFPWVEKLLWDRDLPAVVAEWLGFMRIFYPNQPSGLSQNEIRAVLRAMSDDTRNRFIFWLGQVGQRNEHGWVNHVIPLINDDWPRERHYRTSASVRTWISLLGDTGGEFPAVYDAVKKFLVPVEANEPPFYRFTRENGDEHPITTIFPETTLDLIDRVTPRTLTRLPYQLPKMLALISEVRPDLMSDVRYLRLIDLIERS